MNITDAKSTDVKSLDSLVKGGPWLLTGESGAGKDYVVKTYLASKDFQSLDDSAVKAGSKWVVDVAKICQDPAHLRVYGMVDNLAEVAKTLKECYEKNTLKVIIIQPSYELFKAANAAKASEIADDTSELKKKYIARSKFSLSSFTRLMANRNANILKWTDPTEVLIAVNELREGDLVVNGHHKESVPSKVDAEPIELTDAKPKV